MRRGLRVLPYVDDFLVCCVSLSEALEDRAYVAAVLDLFGLARNPKKGCWEPTQRLQHLGLGIDTVRGIFCVMPDRLAKLQLAAREILGVSGSQSGSISKRRLAGFCGLAQSVYLAVPPAQHYLRSLHDCVASSPSWGGQVHLSPQARADLLWWVHLPERWNGRAIWRSPTTAILSCDASKLGWGAELRSRGQTVLARGFWTADERCRHITLLETQAVTNAILAFSRPGLCSLISGTRIRLMEDNQAVVAMVTRWVSRSPEIMRELRRLWFHLDLADARLTPVWLPSEENVVADGLSRLHDPSDWRFSRSVFLHLNSVYGPYTIDRFASSLNTHLARYNSGWADQASSGVDAFAQSDWETNNNFCCPPWELLPQLAQLLRETGAAATVVAPCWPAQPWFQALQELSSAIHHLPQARDLFYRGRLPPSVLIGPAGWPATVFVVPARPTFRSSRAASAPPAPSPSPASPFREAPPPRPPGRGACQRRRGRRRCA